MQPSTVYDMSTESLVLAFIATLQAVASIAA